MFNTKGKVDETLQDPATGEVIVRKAIPPVLGDPIVIHLTEHSRKAQSFIGTAQSLARLFKQFITLNDEVDKSDQEIKTLIKDCILKMKLDPKENWGFNIEAQCLEMRKPPKEATPDGSGT